MDQWKPLANFVSGIGSILDCLGGVEEPPRVLRRTLKRRRIDDGARLAGDWARVGQDLEASAMKCDEDVLSGQSQKEKQTRPRRPTQRLSGAPTS